jgi:predicted regulator of Ras-like GTPase activity (Roadblock/LC7/MglB family)
MAMGEAGMAGKPTTGNAASMMFDERTMVGGCGLGEAQLAQAEAVVRRALMGLEVDTTLLIDDVGNILMQCGESALGGDLYALAALAAANFSAMSAMARILGEDGFSMLLHKGERESLHVCQVTDELVLVLLFGPRVSLGALRMCLDTVVRQLRYILENG